MAWEPIEKRQWPNGVVPNIVDYDGARALFTWEKARQALDGLPGNRGLNIAHEAVDRHAGGGLRDRVALRWVARDGSRVEATYGELAARTNRFANGLRGLGVGKGDRVFTLLGRVPELYVTVLGTLKNTSVFCPLFSAFGPEPIRQRLALEMPGCSSPPPRSIGARWPRYAPPSRVWSRSCSSAGPVSPKARSTSMN